MALLCRTEEIWPETLKRSFLFKHIATLWNIVSQHCVAGSSVCQHKLALTLGFVFWKWMTVNHSNPTWSRPEKL